MQLHPIKNPHLLRFQPGDRSGSFTVIKALGSKRWKKGLSVIFEVQCDCGNVTQRDRQTLIKPSKGCEVCRATGTKPKGSTAHPLHKRWAHMMDRCTNPKNKSFKDYGARGITVCDRWVTGEGGLSGFECFVQDMGDCPEGLTLERKDFTKGYYPENCIWASRTVQGRNRRSVRMLEFQGKTQPASVWALETGIPYFTLMRRLGLGWSVERALTEAIWPR